MPVTNCFQPYYGASLQILKVEIGGDAQSSGLDNLSKHLLALNYACVRYNTGLLLFVNVVINFL